MWIWLAHRVTGVIIGLYAVAHLVVISLALIGTGKTFDDVMNTFRKPYIVGFEVVLLAVIFFHVLNGLRIILFDLGIGVRAQKQVFGGLMVVGAVLFSVAVWALLPAFSK
jgi:succinate dehydrogenase / fumarate reductase cytochrome b subunit